RRTRVVPVFASAGARVPPATRAGRLVPVAGDELLRRDTHHHQGPGCPARQLGVPKTADLAEPEATVQRQRRDVAAVDADLAPAEAALLEHVPEQDRDGIAGIAAALVPRGDPDAVAEPAGAQVDPGRGHRPDQETL